MSRIEGITVQGVRSFAPMEREAITLFTPLTLIVGYNGSGKTTLIECLRYATTGELPPNSKGGAFVYDPKLCNEKKVFAAVVLKMTGVDGKKYTVNRKLSVTVQKSGNRTMKTEETSLKEVGPSGEKHTKSEKVGAIDERVPELLGVSPAILESVIFCHQDDSLWPMSEPSKLKTKFDEIFEAQKYTKAIDQLKVVRKKKGEQLRLLQIHHKQTEENKNKGQKNRAICQRLTNEIEDFREQVQTLEEEMGEADQNAREKREQANNFLSIMNDLKDVQNQCKFRQDRVADLRNSIEMMTEDDDELRRAFDEYEARLQRLVVAVKKDTDQHSSLQGEVNETQNKLNIKLGEKGKLESDKEKYERQLRTRVEMVREAASRHEIRGFDNDLDDGQVRVFNGKIQGIFQGKKRDHERLQERIAKEADEAGRGISELENRKSTLTSQRTFAKQRRTESDRKIKRLQTEMDSVNWDEGRINILRSDQTTLDERYRNAETESAKNGWDEKIREAQKELGDLEKKSEDLSLELVTCTRLANERAQLNLRKDELKEREKNLETLASTWKSELSEKLRPDWEIESLESSYRIVLGEKTKAVNEAKAKCDAMQKVLNQREFELSEARKRQTTLIASKTKHEKSVMAVLKDVAENPNKVTVEDYNEELDNLEGDRLTFEKDLNLFDHLKHYWTEAKTTLDTKNKCYMCDRAFDGDRSKSKILKKIATNLDEKTKAGLEEDFRNANLKVGRLQAVRSEYEAAQRLVTDLPTVEKAIQEAMRKRDDQLQQLEGADEDLRRATDALEKLETISKCVSDMTQLSKAIKDSREQIRTLQSQSQSSGPTRSAGEVQAAQSAVTEEARRMKKLLDSLSQDRQLNRDLITNLELERTKNRSQIAQAEQQLERKKKLSEEIKSLREDNQQQDETISKIDDELKALQPQIDVARGQRDAALERGRKRAEKVAEERDNVSRTLSQLKIIEDDIRDYVNRGKASTLASIERSIQSHEQQLESLQSEMSDLRIRIDSQKRELAQGDHRKKNINDNLKFREDCRLLDKLTQKIDELKSHNAEEDYERLMREAKQFDDERNLLSAKRTELIGMSKSKDVELARMIEEYEQEYQGAEEEFIKSNYQVETTKYAIDDLGTYHRVLDKAIMHYHSLKMEEVNRIAGELWRATYQGTDIDTIAIRSENENSSSTNTRRSYNYRVTMVKQDTEMDMRGRCSAGQKVLASIIIRLALAESFGINCGVIALDEPTTNLDSDNIRSLAVSLHGIIKARQAQSNFQLIVITHEEEFLRHMRCNDFCDNFYRVKRDENQCSRVRRENITQITE